MKDYYFEDVTAANCTPREASLQINAIMAASRGDHEHPYMYGNHPQHDDWCKHMQILFQIKCSTPEYKDDSPLRKDTMPFVLERTQSQTEPETMDCAELIKASQVAVREMMPKEERIAT